MPSVEEFEERVEETQTGAEQVNDFALKTSFAFPSADVLVPAPMAVSILGQLTLVAAATDFKLLPPRDGFKHVRCPDSFRATIIQLVNAGGLALNRSYANFDEIRLRSATVRPNVNDIVQLLVGFEENTPEGNMRALERYLPNQIRRLERTIQACLDRTRETDAAFAALLDLANEVEQACHLTQGDSEARVREATNKKENLENEKTFTEKQQVSQEQSVQEARADIASKRSEYNSAMNASVPSAWSMFWQDVGEVATDVAGLLTFQFLRGNRSASSNSSTQSSNIGQSPGVDISDAKDPAYYQAETLRVQAEALDILFTSGEGGGPNWNDVMSRGTGGCEFICNSLKHVLDRVKSNHRHAGNATTHAIHFAKRGIEYAEHLKTMTMTSAGGHSPDLAPLQADVRAWRAEVVKFASIAALKLQTSTLGSTGSTFVPPPTASGGRNSEIRARNAQYKLAVAQQQLNLSYERSKEASDKLDDVNHHLADVLGQIASIDIQKQNWEEIVGILRKAIVFLAELKRYLNGLVHFFTDMNNLVSVSMNGAVENLLQSVKDASAIESGEASQKNPRLVEGVPLDAFARQSIYNHALSTAKISRVVENISDMYVTLYNGHVHPGVNMVLGMGGLIGSGDQVAIAAAGEEIKTWASAASGEIVSLVRTRMKANEHDIQKRMLELEKSLGTLLPQTPSAQRIEEIVREAGVEQARESAAESSAPFTRNPFYEDMRKRKSKLSV